MNRAFFDQRPGLLEATSGLGAITVCGTRPPDALPQQPCPDDWQVLVLVQLPGGITQARLTPDEAEQLAQRLTEYAGICRHEHAALEQRRREQAASIPGGGA
ncbi:MAG: hypothetical protein B7Y88_13780 [Sphingomonadales bacterium 32-64-17]|nr:MAG: hypothetical protein B7Y88_13780 [Sphingomonadales bacterium 32-64-17]